VPKLDEAGIVVRSVRGGWEPPTPKPQRFVRLLTPVAVERAPRQQAVVDDLVRRSRLAPSGDPPLVPLPDLLARTGSDHAVVGALARKGVVEEVTVARPLALVSESSEPVPTLTAAQAGAWRSIEDALAARDPTPFLLHGVTGSGKTEVYLRAIGWCVRHDRSAIVLAPEIALASQVVRRVTARFPGRVAVLHSALPEAERAATWAAIAAGQMPVVVGPRSALFAPVDNLGLVVLDEEHDGAYKQDAEPRYHARALAEEIGRRRGAVVVLGSATPAVETTWRAEDGQVRLLRLPDRVGPSMAGGDDRRTGEALELPPVETVDLRLELHRGNPLLLGERLFETLQRTLARREQAILFLNRRGMATVVLCRSCGRTLLCPYCDIPLVYHADRGWLLCHRCDLRQPPAAACSECGGGLNYFGAGTQRVEQEVRRLLPGARVLRWDQDTVRRRGGHEALLRQVERHEVDIVVGTQMIAKGLDLPLVTAVGVVNADTMLHLPDFRSAERTFQLLTQVAGRAGRRGPGSVVIVQSYTPDHYAIRAASRHDYAAFYGEEIAFRRTHRYPPFVRLVRYLVRDPDEARCAAQADEMARRLARHARDRGVEMDLSVRPRPSRPSRGGSTSGRSSSAPRISSGCWTDSPPRPAGRLMSIPKPALKPARLPAPNRRHNACATRRWSATVQRYRMRGGASVGESVKNGRWSWSAEPGWRSSSPRRLPPAAARPPRRPRTRPKTAGQSRSAPSPRASPAKRSSSPRRTPTPATSGWSPPRPPRPDWRTRSSRPRAPSSPSRTVNSNRTA
jgi:primosomal protein N' (replication factor Y)